MKQFQYTIKDEPGVHARPAGLLVKLAKQYTSTITIEKNGKTCDMRKLMAVMGMGIRQGETITVTAHQSRHLTERQVISDGIPKAAAQRAGASG